MHSSIIFGITLAFIQSLNCLGSVPNSRLNFFDIDLLRSVANDKEGNVMISPASIKSTLAMLLEGAEGSTASELKSALRVSPEKEDFRDELSLFVKSLQANSSSVYLRSSNALFLSKKIKLKKEYEMMVQRFYHSEVAKLDFSNTKTAVDLVNAWVYTKTKGLIPTIIEEAQLQPTTEMVLTNAIYFKGAWKYGFDKKLTHGDCFYNKGVCQDVAMMDLQAELKYAFVENLRAHALELPYRGERYSMILLVPQDRDSGMAMLRDLPYVGLPQILGMMYSTDVILTMPKFDLEFNHDLVGALRNMAITSLFSKTANLSGIYDSEEGIYINSICHSVYMKVDEEGTVAAASTASLIVPLINNQVQLRVDRPFVFFIRDNNLGLNLFEGIVEVPTEFVNNGYKEQPKAPEKKKPVPIEPFSGPSTPAPSEQSFHDANPNYDHGGPYQPGMYQEFTRRSIADDMAARQPEPTVDTSEPSSPSPSPSTSTSPSEKKETQPPKKSGGITGFFKRIGSYFDI